MYTDAGVSNNLKIVFSHSSLETTTFQLILRFHLHVLPYSRDRQVAWFIMYPRNWQTSGKKLVTPLEASWGQPRNYDQES